MGSLVGSFPTGRVNGNESIRMALVITLSTLNMELSKMKRQKRTIEGYKIDYNMPCPPRHKSTSSRLYTVLETIKPGCSFIVKDKKEAQLAYMAGRQLGIKIEQRQTKRGSIRVWRAS